MSLSFLSSVYEHINQAGKSQILGVSISTRYHAFRESDLQSLGLYRKISSTVVYPASDSDGTVILFGPFMGFLQMGDYGQYDIPTCDKMLNFKVGQARNSFLF